MKLVTRSIFICSVAFATCLILPVQAKTRTAAVPPEQPEHTVTPPAALPGGPLHFVRGVVACRDGSIWAVGESAGVQRLRPGSGSYDTSSWESMQAYEGFPDTLNGTCIAEDDQHRIWVGTDNKGVAVFNGKEWKVYDVTNALLGEHVFAIAVSPVSGEVALATSGGVNVYDPSGETWCSFTRAEGLAEDQAEALSFDREGNLWLAYGCGGVSVASPKDRYAQWKTFQAPWYWDKKQYVRQPETAEGEGLPSNLGNAMAALPQGEIAVGTCAGIAVKPGKGKWTYKRGRDYQAKNAGVYKSTVKRKKASRMDEKELLPEDYVSALLPVGDRLVVGTRQKGAALFNPKTMKTEEEWPCGEWITSLTPLGENGVLAGTYGGGVKVLRKATAPVAIYGRKASGDKPVEFPGMARVWSKEEVEGFYGKIRERAGKEKSKKVMFYGDDWSTRGNWCFSHGKDYAILCAANAPRSNVYYRNLIENYRCYGTIGPHKDKKDGLRHWVEAINNKADTNVLISQDFSIRTEAEWDDHGEAYPQSHDGPDVWATIYIPEGVHMVSLYFYNPNARQSRNNAFRDYMLEVRRNTTKEQVQYFQLSRVGNAPSRAILTELVDRQQASPVLARGRVRFFGDCGVYKSLIVSSPGIYYVRICRNNSFNTILNGIFLSDLLVNRTTSKLQRNLSSQPRFYGQIPDYMKEEINTPFPFLTQVDARLFAGTSQTLSYRRSLVERYRMEAQQTDVNAVLNKLYLVLHIRNGLYDHQFNEFINRVWDEFQTGCPAGRSKEFAPYSPNTVDLSSDELEVMQKIGIDWKEYLPDNIPKIPIPELRRQLKSLVEQHNAKEKQRPGIPTHVLKESQQQLDKKIEDLKKVEQQLKK